MFEAEESLLERIQGALDLIWYALELGGAKATIAMKHIELPPNEHRAAFSNLVRASALTHGLPRALPPWFLVLPEVNDGIHVQVGDTEIRVLHERDGDLPSAKTIRRERFYRQPRLVSPTLFDLWGDPVRITHTVFLYDYDERFGVSGRLIAPNGTKNHIVDAELRHPAERIDLTDLSANADTFDQVEDVTVMEVPRKDGEDPAGATADEIDDVETSKTDEEERTAGLDGDQA